jgi:hypothetical protein
VPVSYPQTLQLGHLHEDKSIKSTFELCALVEHLGYTPSNGHYVAYRRFLDFKKPSCASRVWIRANDEYIDMLSADDVLMRSQGAYLLFY